MISKTSIILIALMILALLMISVACEEDGDVQEEDSFALWDQQPNEKIVFMSKADSPAGELYLLEKGGEVTRLTNNNRHENNPALSPDGKKVAFHGGDISEMLSWEIYTLNLETLQEDRLTNNSIIDAHPDWSPDGSKIVFGSFRDSEGNPSWGADICVMDADGSGLIQLTENEWEDNDPEWSPDGSKIAFKSTRNTQISGREEIYVMNADGSNVERLSTTTGWESDHDPSWSPDSRYIVFNRFEGTRVWFDITNLDVLRNNFQELIPWNVCKVDLDKNFTKLTNIEHSVGLPVFSKNGSKILSLQVDFIMSNNEPIGADHLLMLVDVDGSNPVQLIPDDRHTPTLEYFDW